MTSSSIYDTAYFDCPAGASGDMIIGAFIDAGLPLEYLKAELAKIHLHGYELTASTVKKQGMAACRFEVAVDHQHHHRHWSDIREMIEDSRLSNAVKAASLAVFERLARAEGKMHGVEPDHVHFHEVGAVDSIVDMVGAAVAREYFGLKTVWASPLPLGTGFVQTAHGRLPLPAPAALALLEGVPTYGCDLDVELVTPTGAAVLAAMTDGFGPRPPMVTGPTGMGAGMRDLPDRPNIIRLTLGRSMNGSAHEALAVLETNIDDMNPEILPHVMQRLLSNGALDAWLTPIQMKKGRPAAMLSTLAKPLDVDRLKDIILAETSTLGIRSHMVFRSCLPREQSTVQTPYGPVAVKVIQRNGRKEIAPEFEACRKLAEEQGLPLRDVYDLIRKAAEGE